MPPTARVRVQLDLLPELDEWLRGVARERETSRNALIVSILSAYRDDAKIPKVTQQHPGYVENRAVHDEL